MYYFWNTKTIYHEHQLEYINLIARILLKTDTALRKTQATNRHRRKCSTSFAGNIKSKCL